MFDFGGFGNGVIGLLCFVLQMYGYIVLIRVLISWVSPDPTNPIVQFLRAVTDPAMDRLRPLLPRFFWATGLDFTPLVLLLLLQLIIIFLRSFRFG